MVNGVGDPPATNAAVAEVVEALVTRLRAEGGTPAGRGPAPAPPQQPRDQGTEPVATNFGDSAEESGLRHDTDLALPHC